MKTQIVNPSPFFEISMECSNRRFYETKETLFQIACKIDDSQEMWSDYVSTSCDYEGDLDKIYIYNCDETKDFIDAIIKEFEITDIIPDGMELVFTT